MYYIFDYSLLIEKLNNYYNETYSKMIIKLSRDLHKSPQRYKNIFELNKGEFSQNEITTLIHLLNLSEIDIKKCFFNVVKSSRYKKDLY